MFSKVLVAGLLASAANAFPRAPRQAPQGKLAVYWGTGSGPSLDEVCADPSYQFINLSFLDTFFADGGYPSMNIDGLWESSDAQNQAGATGLKDGSSIVDAIKSCQDAGKLVMLSLGGWGASVTLANDDEGVKIANTLWNLFGGGTEDADLRPFGDVKLDGFDLDNESGDPTGYLAMTKQFRTNFGADTSKDYFLTAAPQCPFPDASQPLDVCQQLDHVWVQFYNNGDCNVAQGGFEQAVRDWSGGIGDAKLYIGALASDSDGDAGYVDIDTMVGAIQGVQAMNLTNYAGAMLWDARLASSNGDYQKPLAQAL